MKLTRIVCAKVPQSPFPRSGKTFDSLFVAPQRPKKAWDGQDKDAFFRDKYAHVHAKQLKRKEEEQARKRERESLKGNNKKYATAAEAAAAAQPRRDFARKFAEQQARNPKMEYLYGTNAVRAVLETRRCERVYTGYKSVADLDPQIVALCRSRNVHIETGVPAQHLEIMTDHGVHNRIVVQAEKRNLPQINSLDYNEENKELIVNNGDETSRAQIPVKPRSRFTFPLGLFIDQVTDTHNMGALLRSAQYFGADFVAVSSRNSAPLSPAVVKASSGASEFIPILEVSRPLRVFDQLRESGWAIIASAPNQEVLQQREIDLHSVDPRELATKIEAPTLLVVGSEGDGIRTSLLQRSTHQTRLGSSQTAIDSLNVSVAAAVLLHSFAD